MYIVFDIGGTNMRMAVSRDGETLDAPLSRSTPQDFEEGLKVFGELFAQLSDGVSIVKCAGGVAGVFNRRRQQLYSLPHLPHWNANEVKDRLSKIVGNDVIIENDAAMVGLGEAVSGAGRGYSIVAYITISTGVGGARIVDGKLDAGVMNSEPGHMIIDSDGTLCSECPTCGDGISGAGHWESFISGASLEKRLLTLPSENHDSQVWDDEARFIAKGLANTIVHWAPDVVVLGGGVMNSVDLTIDLIRKHLKDTLTIYPVHPDIIKAELGNFGGLYGALKVLH